MIIDKVDLNRIKELLDSVPGKMEITSIDLTNGYSLNLVAGEQEINQAGFEDALNQLNDILGFYKSLEGGNKLLKKIISKILRNCFCRVKPLTYRAFFDIIAQNKYTNVI